MVKKNSRAKEKQIFSINAIIINIVYMLKVDNSIVIVVYKE